MTTRWVWKTHVIVPIADVETIRAIAADIDPDPASTGGFTVRLSANGEEPATHVYGGWPMTEAMRSQADAIVAAWEANGLSECPRVWRCYADTSALASSNVSAIGDNAQHFDTDDVLAAAGLQIIRPPDEEGP